MRSNLVICGSCDFPSHLHGSTDGIVAVLGAGPMDKVLCFRLPEDIGHASWLNDKGREFSDYLVVDHSVLLNPSVAGPAVSNTELRSNEGYWESYRFGAPQGEYISGTYTDEHDYEFPTREQDALDRWYDKALTSNGAEWICTPTLEQHQSPKMGASTEVTISKKGHVAPYATIDLPTEDRNAYVEGNPGFLSVHLLDEQLTKKHHAKLLNVFLDKKTSDVRIGAIRITDNVDGSITARCVNANCGPNGRRASMTIYPVTATREEMESFTWACVSHGNNHAAAFIRTRENFHKVHHLGCNIDKCDETSVTCTHIEYKEVVTDAEVVRFLMEHNDICQDSRCKCSERLEELVPALRTPLKV